MKSLVKVGLKINNFIEFNKLTLFFTMNKFVKQFVSTLIAKISYDINYSYLYFYLLFYIVFNNNLEEQKLFNLISSISKTILSILFILLIY